tara:strand:- start:2067 stop:2357 length:291 start_codon:yes stop_codon:yes gene_type:complete
MKSIDIIKKAVLEINKQLDKKRKIVVKKNFQILGPKSNLDSLIVVNLFIAIEEKIKAFNGKTISLLSDDFFDKRSETKYTMANLEKDLNKKIKKNN